MEEDNITNIIVEEEEENKKTKAVETFCEITSSSKQEALFLLESFNWDLDSAVQTFLEDNNNIDLNVPAPELEPIPLRSESPPLPIPTTSSMASRDKKPSKKPSGSGSGSGSGAGRIRTLSDLNRSSSPGSDSDSDHDAPQEYYTGGEKSGMLVQGPPKHNDVDSIFDQARQLGAVEAPPDHLRPSSSARSFAGTGRLLSGETVAAAPQQPEFLIHNIVFWRNGFTVDDGPLRSLDDPENAPFLESIKKSECPKELEPSNRSSPVHVNLTRRDENCPEPEKRQIPFQGVGRTLGSSNPAPSEPTLPAAPVTSVPSLSIGLFVDPALPSTSIQLRLADGTRMIARFNFHHTVSDIRSFIDASRPGGTISYQLQTVGFPPKQLSDVTQTIEQAGLANSVVVQKS
ncbi:hypothetical protein GIB67_032742 [Kingdonia uniflora]|uniref:Uncharacterized protein n=1 Tax=Kingdonia uniflora TaxID=39325 RepID=A0A7J7MW41_9MAGN|nr:hypothetical protein GIB67_032742 [Kingdonia uniflora]